MTSDLVSVQSSRSYARRRVVLLVECAVAAALAFLLSFFKLWRLPQSGEVSLEMVPVLIFSLLRGVAPGYLCGLCFGLLHFPQDPFYVHPLQFILDYPLAYASLGLAGITSGKRLTIFRMLVGIAIGVGGRFLCHLLSGVIFIGLFLEEPPAHPWKYSLVYNGSYILPELFLAWFLVPVVVLRLAERGKGKSSSG